MIRQLRMPPNQEEDGLWKNLTVELTDWVKKEGEFIQKGELFLVIETGKGDAEIESDVSGVLLKVLAHEGEEISLPCVVGLVGDSVEDANSSAFAEELKKIAERV